MINEIKNRRSIRKFSTREIPENDLRELLESAINAPSSKNRQPWKFIVVKGQAKADMLTAFRKGIEREEYVSALLPNSSMHLAAAKHTIEIMEQAPVSIFVVNRLGTDINTEHSIEDKIYEICNIQSVSAAIQNLLLEATARNIGSLWICDIYFAYEELCSWLNTEGELLAAICLGYPEESPAIRRYLPLEDIVEWRD